MDKYVLIVAGGKGIPMRGKPLLMHTLEAFHRWDASARIILVLPEDHQPYWNMLCKEIGCKVPHAIVKGGDTRFFSVKNGLDWLLAERRREEDSGLSLVAVHDGVRPFVSPEVVEACFDKAAVTGAVIPVVPMIDSLRETDEKGSHPVDRSRYMAVQTPQVFLLELLTKAYEQPYSSLFTDDASVVEAMGHAIDTVPGDRENIKITTPFDLLIAEAMFAR